MKRNEVTTLKEYITQHGAETSGWGFKFRNVNVTSFEGLEETTDVLDFENNDPLYVCPLGTLDTSELKAIKVVLNNDADLTGLKIHKNVVSLTMVFKRLSNEGTDKLADFIEEVNRTSPSTGLTITVPIMTEKIMELQDLLEYESKKSGDIAIASGWKCIHVLGLDQFIFRESDSVIINRNGMHTRPLARNIGMLDLTELNHKTGNVLKVASAGSIKASLLQLTRDFSHEVSLDTYQANGSGFIYLDHGDNMEFIADNDYLRAEQTKELSIQGPVRTSAIGFHNVVNGKILSLASLSLRLTATDPAKWDTLEYIDKNIEEIEIWRATVQGRSIFDVTKYSKLKKLFLDGVLTMTGAISKTVNDLILGCTISGNFSIAPRCTQLNVHLLGGSDVKIEASSTVITEIERYLQTNENGSFAISVDMKTVDKEILARLKNLNKTYPNRTKVTIED